MVRQTRRSSGDGGLVLVKVRGYPPWPAKICKPEDYDQEPKKDKVFVYFFGSKQIGFYSPDDVSEFQGEGRRSAIARASAKTTKQLFRSAIAEALQEEKQTGDDSAGETDDEEDADATPLFQTPPPPKTTSRVKTPRTEVAGRSTKKFAVGESIAGGASIIDAIKWKNSKVVKKLAKDWVERYEQESSSALAALLTSLFQCCGVDYTLQPEEDLDVDDIVPSLVAAARSRGLEDYLSSRQKDAKNFKQNLLEFWDALVAECQDQILFETTLFSRCVSFITGISSASPRTFRHVATLVGLQLVTSFVGVARTLGELRETKQRQLNAERKKNKEGPRVESLTNAVAHAHKKITKVEEMMRSIFTGLFMHRYRDVDPEIRCACISSIGLWIEAYPALFLQDLYLKYIGWTLNDRDPTVRVASVSALTALYAVEANISSLGLFTERFGPRMVELADDIDPLVAVKAIGLLRQLLRHELLTDEDMEPLYELLVDELPQLRHAVGELVHEHLIAQTFHGSDTEDEKEDPEVQLKRLLEVMSQYAQSHQSGTYVVDALWEKTQAMQDWKCVVELLLNDKPRDELSDKNATNLIHVLNASVKKSVGERLVPNLDTRKVVLSKKEKDAHENNRKELTSALMKPLPELLRKFSVDSTKSTYLIDIIPFMDLEQFALKRQESLFSEILQLVKNAFFKHGEDELLESCVKASTFCAKEGQGDLQQTSEQTVKSIVSELEQKLAAAIKQVGEGMDEDDDDYSLLVNLKRFHWLQLSSNCVSEEMIDGVISLLEDFNHLNDEVVEFALSNFYLYVAWHYEALDFNDPGEADMRALVSRREKLLLQLQNFMMNILDNLNEHHQQIALPVMVVKLLSDTWTIFSQNRLDGTTMESLGYSPEEALIRDYWKLCEHLLALPDKVFEKASQSKDEVMAAAARLAALDLVHKDYLSSQIVSHYILHGKSVSEMVKTFCNRVKQATRPQDQWKLYMSAMTAAHARHLANMTTNDYEDYADLETFVHCKELSAKLAATYSGFGRQANGPSIWKIVQAGIEYAFCDLPRQLSFLECGVLPFALKLPPARMRDVLENLESRAEECDREEDANAWHVLDICVEHIQEKADKPQATSPGADREENEAGGRRGGGRRAAAEARNQTETEKEPMVESDGDFATEDASEYDVRRRAEGFSQYERGEPSSRPGREEDPPQPIIREYTRKSEAREATDGDDLQPRKMPMASQTTGGTEDVLLREDFSRGEAGFGSASDARGTENGWGDQATATQATEEQLPGCSRSQLKDEDTEDNDVKTNNSDDHATHFETPTENGDDDLYEIDINRMPAAVSSKRPLHTLSDDEEEGPALLKRRRRP